LPSASSAEDRAAAAYHIGGLIPLGRHVNATMKIAAVMPCAEAG
jgi:hypothetical protein